MRFSLQFAAFTEVRNLAAALAIHGSAGCENIGLLIDPLHFARTGADPDDLNAIAPGRFHYAQFCDAAANGPPPEDVPGIVKEALDHRLPICAGGLPLGALLGMLPKNLPLSIELRPKGLRETYPDPADRARALLQSTRAV